MRRGENNTLFVQLAWLVVQTGQYDLRENMRARKRMRMTPSPFANSFQDECFHVLLVEEV